jgi:hypothetical protein
MNVYLLPKNGIEAATLVQKCKKWDDDHIAKLGKNMVVLRHGSAFTFRDRSSRTEVTFEFVQVKEG